MEEELQERKETIEENVKFIRNILPQTLKRLSKIEDYRNPLKITHALSVLICYGIIIFLYQITSRRAANRELTPPIIFENLNTIIPEFKTMPHADTLARLLERIDVDTIREEAGNIINKFIRNKKFKNLLVNKFYTIAIDGTGKFSRNTRWAPECLEKRVSKKLKNNSGEEKMKYYCYVVEACFVFQDGLTLPFDSEFLEYSPEITGAKKKDCETKGFKRIINRIHKKFPKLKIIIVADGLFANGPAMQLLKDKKWEYMIALKDDSLKTVWKNFNKNMETEKYVNTKNNVWGDRNQTFYWSNEILYTYDTNGVTKQIKLHIVECEENWKERKSNGEIEEKHIKFVWISSSPITSENVISRCNLIARSRWGIESNILLEKHYGYNYEHCYSYNWNAMKGYHYLMHIAHIINKLMFNTKFFYTEVREKTMRGVIGFFKTILKSALIDKNRITDILNRNWQIRFIF